MSLNKILRSVTITVVFGMCSKVHRNEIQFHSAEEFRKGNRQVTIYPAILFLPRAVRDGLSDRPACSIAAMKKPIHKKRVAPTRTASKSVEEYAGGIPEESRSNFERLRSTIRSVVPKDSVEVINYGVPAFKAGKVLVWFAAFSQHCSIFPTSSVIEEFKSELKSFTISKGTVQFPNDKPLPIPLIKKMVKARLAAMSETVPARKK